MTKFFEEVLKIMKRIFVNLSKEIIQIIKRLN